MTESLITRDQELPRIPSIKEYAIVSANMIYEIYFLLLYMCIWVNCYISFVKKKKLLFWSFY